MNSPRMTRWGGALVLVGLLLGASGCQKLKARDELNKGIAEYKNVQYPRAIEHFKVAVQLEPTNLNARLYLATAYANQYVPGSETDENIRVGEQAIEEFQNVLKEDANNLGSISGIASLYFQMKRMEDAKEYYQKQIQMEPANPEPYYSVGVIDWTMTYQPRIVLKSRLKQKPDEFIKDAKERQALAERNAPLVEEGMQMLNKAMELRQDYHEAMAYLNLLYREKADLVETPQEREELTKTADSWMDKSLATKKAVELKEQEKQQQGAAGG